MMKKLRETAHTTPDFAKACKATKSLSAKLPLGLVAGLLMGVAPISGLQISRCEAQPVLSTPQNLGRPASGKTAVYARNVWDMTLFENKIYIGVGSSSPNSGDTPVITLNPATNAYTREYVVKEEQIDRYEIINGTLYIPGHDYTVEAPRISQVYKKTGEIWGVVGQVQSMAHLFSLVEFGGKLYASGGNWSGNFSIFASADNGTTWQGVGDSRFYRPDGTTIAGNGARHWLLMPLAGQLYSFRYSYVDGTQQQFAKLNQTTGMFEPYFLPSSVFAPGITGQVPRFRYRNPLYLSDGTALVQGVINGNDFQWSPLTLYHVTDMVAGGVRPIPVPEGVVFDHVLRGNTIYLCAWNATNKHNIVYALNATNLTAAPVEVLRFAAPTFARSFEEVNGSFYFGLGCGETTVPQTGEIWKVSTQQPNTPPQVSLSAPTTGATFTAPAAITLAATATDADGTIAKVEFFDATTKVGEDLTAPYELTLPDVAPGTHSYTAQATDNGNLSATSAAATISVLAPPTVTLDSPTEGASFATPSMITLAATASDSDGVVSKVEFFANDQKIGEDLTAPYSVAWNSAGVGNYVLKAVATDDSGLLAISNQNTVQFTATRTPIADSYASGGGAGLNYGASAQLQAKTADTGSTRWIYLKFDLGTVSGPISSATLRLRGGGGSSGGTSSAVFAVSDTTWSETGLTWNNKPALGSELSRITIPSTAIALHSWNVTSYLQSEKAAGRNIVTLAIKNPQITSTILNFNARESVATGGTAPQIIIN